MKKWIISGLVVVFMITAGIGFYFWTHQAGLTAEDLLPEGAVVYINSKNVAKNLKGFTKSRLFQNISNIDVPSLMEKSGVTKEQIAQYENFKKQVSSISQNFLLEKFFGKEIALAVYPTAFSTSSPQAIAEAVNSFTLVTSLDAETQFVEFMTRVLKASGLSYTTEEVKYKNYKITNIVSPIASGVNIKVSYVKIRNFLVLGLGEEVSRRSIDVVMGARGALTKDKNFLRVRPQFLEDAQVIVYANIAAALAKFNEEMEKFA